MPKSSRPKIAGMSPPELTCPPSCDANGAYHGEHSKWNRKSGPRPPRCSASSQFTSNAHKALGEERFRAFYDGWLRRDDIEQPSVGSHGKTSQTTSR